MLQFKYTFKPYEFHRIYTGLIYASPRLKISIIAGVILFCLGIVIGNVLLNTLPNFDTTWEQYSWLPWLFLGFPIAVGFYQSGIVKGISDNLYRASTWDGAEVLISFLEDCYKVETEHTSREVKWKGLQGIRETKYEFTLYAHQQSILHLEKSQLEPDLIPKIRAFLKTVQISQIELLND